MRSCAYGSVRICGCVRTIFVLRGYAFNIRSVRVPRLSPFGWFLTFLLFVSALPATLPFSTPVHSMVGSPFGSPAPRWFTRDGCTTLFTLPTVCTFGLSRGCWFSRATFLALLPLLPYFAVCSTPCGSPYVWLAFVQVLVIRVRLLLLPRTVCRAFRIALRFIATCSSCCNTCRTPPYLRCIYVLRLGRWFARVLPRVSQRTRSLLAHV